MIFFTRQKRFKGGPEQRCNEFICVAARADGLKPPCGRIQHILGAANEFDLIQSVPLAPGPNCAATQQDFKKAIAQRRQELGIK